MDMRSNATGHLFDAILKLENIDECYRFFEDLCTIKELKALAQRFQIATLLEQGVNYQTIARIADTSTATISRVSQCLNYGSGGYRAILKKLNAAKEEQ